MEKLKQLNDLIKEEKQDREQCWRQWEHNKRIDEEAQCWTEQVKDTREAYLNRI